MAGAHGKVGGPVAGDAVRSGRYPLAARREHWPAEAREDFEERAAILEFDARMERSRAESAAEQIVRERWARDA